VWAVHDRPVVRNRREYLLCPVAIRSLSRALSQGTVDKVPARSCGKFLMFLPSMAVAVVFESVRTKRRFFSLQSSRETTGLVRTGSPCKSNCTQGEGVGILFVSSLARSERRRSSAAERPSKMQLYAVGGGVGLVPSLARTESSRSSPAERSSSGPGLE
jgi:hypothetical protein